MTDDDRDALYRALIAERYETPRPLSRGVSTAKDWTRDDRDRLAADVVDTLLSVAPRPMTTNQIAERLGLGPFERGAYLWPVLDRMVRRGEAERIRVPDAACRSWRLRRESEER